MANSYTTTRIYEREWRDATPSRRIFDHHLGSNRLLDDPFFRRMPFSGSLESLRTTGVGAPSSNADRETKYTYSSSSPNPRSEEKLYVDDRTRFTVMLDLCHFTPEEITVKVANETLIIDAAHKEKRDEHGFVTRSFNRRYPLPKDVDAQGFTSELTKEGTLTVRAPKIDVHQRMKERTVPVQVVTSTRPNTTAGPSRRL